MPAIPLGLQAYERNDGFQPETLLVNFFIEVDETFDAKEGTGVTADGYMRLQRPGLSAFQTLTGSKVRGLHFTDGIADSLPVAVVGNRVVVFDGATETQLGTISDDGFIASIASTYDKLGVVSGGLFYTYDGETFANVALPDSQPVISLDTINSYFVVGCPDGTFYWMSPTEATINALSFATAESSPDGLKCVKRLGDELFFFGGSTTEVWQPTGDADAPFQRGAGRNYDKGTMATETIQNFDNSLVWVGNDGVVYRASNVPQRISTHAIEERIRKRSDSPSAFTFLHDSHLFYVLRIPGQGTFAYDAASRTWSEFSTYQESVWRPWVACDTPDGALVGDSSTGKVWLLDPNSNTDDGTVIERIVSGSVPIQGRPVRVDNFTLLVGSSADCDWQVRWFDGRQTPGSWTTLSARAPVDNPSIHRLGAANEPIRTFEVRCVADAKVRISGALINEAWQNR